MNNFTMRTPELGDLMNPHVWKEDELEYLGRCPVCSSSDRALKYKNVPDLRTRTLGEWNYYHCVGCEVLYLDPRPTELNIKYIYENYYTHTPQQERKRENWTDRFALGMRNDYLSKKYGYRNEPALGGGNFLMYLLPPWLRLEWDHFARDLPKAEPGKNCLLDVGCGNGQFLVTVRSAGWHVTGIDFDQAAVHTAQKLGVDARLGALAEQHFPDCSFDVVTLSHMIEHVHNPRELVTECARILKPGGILWLVTPNNNSIIHKKFKNFWYDLCPHHLVLFNPNSLKKVLQSCNFTVIQKQRGLHIQSHWLASKAIIEGSINASTIYLEPFMNRKLDIRYWPLELIVYFNKKYQGHIVFRGIKN